MRLLSVVVAVVILAAAVSARKPKWNELTENYSFDEYKRHFGKVYSSAVENSERKSAFEANLRTILAHNAQKSASYRMGVNHMTDWKASELKAVLGYDKGLGHYQHRERARKVASGELKYPNLPEAPHQVDWRGKGVLTAVKDQGHCGSCWTFAASETIESAWAIASGELQAISEQHILSCVANPDHCGGTGGCMGGTAELVFGSDLQSGGIASEWVYPYLSYYGNNSGCQWTRFKGHVATWSSYQTLPTNDAQSLMSAVSAHGPIAISVDASTWHLYESGVFDGCNQENPDINHAVQLVGYGTDQTTGQDYWVVRNSWSPYWGEEGFVRLLRHTNAPCGTDTTPLDGVACEGEDSPVTVCGTCGILFDSSYVVI